MWENIIADEELDYVEIFEVHHVAKVKGFRRDKINNLIFANHLGIVTYLTEINNRIEKVYQIKTKTEDENEINYTLFYPIFKKPVELFFYAKIKTDVFLELKKREFNSDRPPKFDSL